MAPARTKFWAFIAVLAIIPVNIGLGRDRFDATRRERASYIFISSLYQNNHTHLSKFAQHIEWLFAKMNLVFCGQAEMEWILRAVPSHMAKRRH
jgi:hypothetical protein